MLHIAICDDDKCQRETTIEYITKLLPACTTSQYRIFAYGSVAEFMAALDSEKFHIVFMDIDLGDDELNGISLGKVISGILPDCQIIFFTGHTEYLSDVYRVSHTYFVLKTDMDKYLPLALSKALNNIEEKKLPSLYIENQRTTLYVPQEEIIYLERVKRITIIYTVTAQYTTYKSFDELMECLDREAFIRCHRSFMVNLFYVREIRKTGFLCKGNVEVPIGRTYYVDIKNKFAEFVGGML